ncbi:cytochrome c biogenesis CcdA family protein [Humibacter antri]
MTGAAIGYAFTLGLVGLLNPCGFPLLPAYLTMFIGTPADAWHERLWAALRAGLCVTAGFVATFGVLGLLAGSLSAALDAAAPWLMLAIGGVLVVIGVLAVLDRVLRWQVARLPFPAGRGPLAMAGFGVAYATGSLSCSLPIFLAGVGASFSSGSLLQGTASFLAYALGMGLFVTAASVAAAFAGAAVLKGLRGASVMLPRIAGAVCVVLGLYLAGYGMHTLGLPDPLAWAIIDVDRVQAAVTGWLDASWLPIAVVFCAVVCGALLVLALRGTAAQRRDEADSSRMNPNRVDSTRTDSKERRA